MTASTSCSRTAADAAVSNNAQIARDAYRAYEDGERGLIESLLSDDLRFRNTEVITITDGRITRVEVYFGWEL
jgi:ketosteroid isomerase-like protein